MHSFTSVTAPAPDPDEARRPRSPRVFTPAVLDCDGTDNVFEVTTVGNKRVVPLNGLTTDMLRIFVISSRDTPESGKISVY